MPLMFCQKLRCSKQQAERGVTDDVQTMFMDAMVYGSFQNDARMTWLMAIRWSSTTLAKL